MLKAAQKLDNGYIRAFGKPQNLTRWISERAKNEYAAEISPQAADAIASVVNADLLRADNELCKLGRLRQRRAADQRGGRGRADALRARGQCL